MIKNITDYAADNLYRVKISRTRYLVELHEKALVDYETFREPCGRISNCLSPEAWPNFEPHYYVKHKYFDRSSSKWEFILACQIFSTDMEYDGFITDVVHVGHCETHMHITYNTLLDGDHLISLGRLIKKAEIILPQLEEQYEKRLNKTEKETI